MNDIVETVRNVYNSESNSSKYNEIKSGSRSCEFCRRRQAILRNIIVKHFTLRKLLATVNTRG